MSSELIWLSAVELLEGYGKGEFSPVEVTQAVLDRIDDKGEALNAFSLVDGERQWFKSRQGLHTTETPRDMAFCSHAITQDAVFLVSDAIQDPRFADNPLVTGKPHVRFYAGVPLALADGSRIGTLCLIDTRPRELDETKLALLRDLGKMLEREFDDTPAAITET